MRTNRALSWSAVRITKTWVNGHQYCDGSYLKRNDSSVGGIQISRVEQSERGLVVEVMMVGLNQIKLLLLSISASAIHSEVQSLLCLIGRPPITKMDEFPEKL